ncbi:uncharacterized protein A4U43_C10F16220 [Asparagus officinalis]|uniref:Integrase catalytic domain-containing protein n=1 Tax=Asparagus officinalis TaxID=4686 RepID=A0A5P1E339_ASPOF|nr:uncharacterized protein A4U43_C10F16220 [Asparagus officinalis]
MVTDAVAYAKRCYKCQIHANYMHQPPEDLHPTRASWPFEAWGMDIVGPISPPSAKGHRFILAITDYFSKWAEAIPLREVKTSNVIKFIKHHVIYRYGVPRRIIHDNGTQFVSHAFTRFCDKFRIQNLSSTAYNPSANGLAEAFNKTIIKILTKLTSTSKRDWNEKLGESLWAYRTTVRTPTGRRAFKEGELVLSVRRPMILTFKKKGKFQSKWEGPFVVETVYSNGAYRLVKPNGDKIMMPINGKYLKKYYP